MSDGAVIHAALAKLDRRIRSLAAARLVLLGVAAAGGTALAAALIDRVLPLPPVVRAGVVAVLAVELFAGLAAAAVAVFGRRFDAVATARKAEAVDAHWGERLSTVMTQAALPDTRRASADLLRALAGEVAAEVRARPPVRLARPLLVWPGVMAVLLVAIAWAGAASFDTLELPLLVRRQMRPFAGPPPVTTTRIVVAPHSGTVRQGDDFVVAADVTTADGPVTIDVGADAGQTRSLQMRPEAGTRYAVTLLAVQRDFVYRIRAGDAVAGPVTVRVSRSPGVSDMALTAALVNGPRRAVAFDGGVAFVPAGAACELELHTTEPLRRVDVRVGTTDVVAAGSEDRRTWRARFVATEDAPLSTVLTAESGVVASGPAGLKVSVLRPAARP